MKKIPAWIYIKYDKQPAYFLCERCKSEREVHMPAAIDDVLKQSEAFAETHRICKK